MTEENSERQGRSKAMISENRLTSHTSSPPQLADRKRNGSSEPQPVQKVDFHERNIEHLKILTEKKYSKQLKEEEENKKSEQTRERLARMILKRIEQLKKTKELEKKKEDYKKIEECIKEEPEENEQAKKLPISAYYRSRYASLLKTIQENNKIKAQEKEIEEQKKQKFKQKLKEEMGLVNVTSKLFNPTVSSLVGSSSITENEIVELKGSKYASNIPIQKSTKKSQVKPPEDDKEKQKARREAAEKIKKRALEHLVQIADKKEQEARKELEAKKKEEKLKASLRDVVLARSKNTELPKEEIKEETAEDSDSSDSPTLKKTKKSDESALRRLSQAPKRWNAPLITDLSVFRKKYKLSEKDKIFIVIGGYPDIRRALLNRSISYLGRLV
jgi:hypothetical protein